MTVREWLAGASYVLAGLRVLRRERDLLRYGVAPLLLTGCALLGGLYGALALHDEVLAWLWAEPTAAGAWGSILRVLHGTAQFLVFLVMAAATSLLAVALSSVIAAPFNDLLSEAIEERLLGRPAPPFSLRAALRGATRSLRLELFKLGAYLAVIAPTWLLSFLLPGFGGVLYAVFAALFSAAYLALDYVDWPASRRGLGVGARLSLLGKHTGRMLGFGTAVWMLLAIPLLNLLFMPIAVAGGTLLFLDLERERVNRAIPSTSEPGSRW